MHFLKNISEVKKMRIMVIKMPKIIGKIIKKICGIKD